MESDRSKRDGGTIYVTSHVCFGCAKLIANSGITRVVVSTEEEARAYRNPQASYRFLQECGLEVDLQGDDLLMAVRIAGKDAENILPGSHAFSAPPTQLYHPTHLVD